jgi:hypothetical protein
MGQRTLKPYRGSIKHGANAPKNRGISMIRHRLTTVFIFMVLGLIIACSGGEQAVAVATGTPTATAIPLGQTKPAVQIEPQSQALMLRITSPEVNLVTELNQVTVAGVTSPDATLSVNGRLLFPDAEGLFSIDLDSSGILGPMVIEIVASSITGETESEIRPVIFSGEAGKSGLFGTMSSVTPSNITLHTESGPVSLPVGAGTSVAIHGWKSPSVSNITHGTLVGVMNQGIQTESVLAVVSRPVRTRHFTGVVSALEVAGPSTNGSITLLDSSGLQITAITTDETAQAAIGTLITAVLEQDVSSGDLTATAIDPALEGAWRIFEALTMNQRIDSQQTKENITALRWRLMEHGVRNVSMLVNSQPHESWQDEVSSAEETYAKLFSKHHIGAPSADVTGLVTSIATSLGTSAAKLITVQPTSGQPVMVKLSENTPVALFGERIRSGQLDLASRITVRYSISGNNANRVTVMAGNTLSRESSARLAAVAGIGEVQGVLMDIEDSELVISIMVDRATGQQISLQSDGAPIFRNGVSVELESSLEGSKVFARFDPATYRLLEMESLSLARGEDLVSGVVHSFIPKFADGNLTVRTIDGQMRTFTHNANTAIRRDGLRVSIHDVRPGDLVRPNTKVRTFDGIVEIVSLSLKTPEPGRATGIIRGVTPGLGGQVQVTISNLWLDLISLKVNSDTHISQQGHALGVQDLKVGQKVALATYDPVILEAFTLALNAPIETGRASR